jgi:hypothetical protein
MALVGNISGSVQSNSEIGLSGTIIIANQPNNAFPDMPGTNVTFFVSGSANTDTDVSVFGGDLTVSGSFIGLGDLLEVSGTLAVTEGISGSLTTLADGTSYLIEGANITITSQSNGSIVISSTGGGGGGGNEFFESTVAGAIFTTGSAAFIDQEAVTSPSDKGTDVFFYVSGSEGSKDGPTPGVALFGGDVSVSGSLTLPSNFLQVTGTLEVTNGISGSLTQLTDGTSYLIAGSNIEIVSQSNGSVLISNTFSQADDYFDSVVAGSIITTGSTAFIDQEVISSPSDKGADVFFYVSGSIGSKDGATPGVSLFGGDVVISGSVYTEGNKFEMTGTLEVTNGISGSLTQLTDGTSYLVEGTNVTIVSQSNGSIVISSTVAATTPAGTGNEVQYNNGGSFGGSSNFEFDGSTVYLTGSLEVGSNSKANGLYSLAQGLNSNANAQYSIAMGRSVSATAQWAFAHGDTTLAAGTTSHAEGKQTKAYGAGSHVEGEQTEATAAYSHAEGYYTITSASHQHADGKFNLRDNNHSLLVIGNGTGDDNSLRSDVVRVEMDSVQISGSLLQRNSGSSLVGFMGDDSAMIPTQKGTDVFFYVSGSIGSQGTATAGTALFGGDLVVSGGVVLTGELLEVRGTIEATQGISGSLTQLVDGTSYLVAGNNISIVSQSNGSILLSSSQQTITFKPGGDAGDNVFTTWPDVMAAFNQTKGIVFIDIDDSLATPAVSSGTHDLESRAIIRGVKTGLIYPSQLTLPDGAVLRDVRELQNFWLLLFGTSTPNFEFNNDDRAVQFRGISYIDLDVTATQPFARIASALNLMFTFRDDIIINNWATNGRSFLDITNAGASVTISMSDNTIVNNNNFISGIGTIYTYHDSSVTTNSSIALPTNPNFTGTTTLSPLDNSKLIAYDDSLVSSNLGSDKVQGAIDALKLRWISTTTNAIYTTSSVAIRGNESGIDATIDKGADVFFYVSGSIGSKESGVLGTSLFGGDVFVSGSVFATGDILEMTGTIIATQGFSGSLTRLIDGTSYIAAGDNVTVTSSSSGQITISSTQGASYWESTQTDIIFTTGSIEATGSLTVKSNFILDGTFRQGDTNLVTGLVSHAQGFLTTGSGNYSHAEGGETWAIGIYSHAEGYKTIASGSFSHAEGHESYASGTQSHAEGYHSLAIGVSSHAEGYFTTASADDSHSEGYKTITYGYASHAEGSETIAWGTKSHAEGFSTLAYGDGSHVEGSFTTASLFASHAEGQNTHASGSSSHAEGYYSITFGFGSHAEGHITTASVDYSHAEGNQTHASGNFSHAEGGNTLTIGESSHAEGGSTTAIGFASHTEGFFTTTTGLGSHAEGAYSTADGSVSHAEGAYTLTTNDAAHAEGYLTTGSGIGSHAEGYLTVASGNYSHAGGIGTIASGSGQTVFGSYNKRENNFSLFVVGNGTSDVDVDRSDIFRVNLGVVGDGRVEVTGSLAATTGFSGSLTTLTDGTSYLIAGANTIITSASNGAVTVGLVPSLTGSFSGSFSHSTYTFTGTGPFTAPLQSFILVDVDTDPTTLYLPAGAPDGFQVIVKRHDTTSNSRSLWVSGSNSDTIDNINGSTISANYGSSTFVKLGAGWYIV